MIEQCDGIESTPDFKIGRRPREDGRGHVRNSLKRVFVSNLDLSCSIRVLKGLKKREFSWF